MKLHFSNEWLRRKIKTDPEHEPIAGDLDMGERYVVTFYDEKANLRRLFARTNNLWEARRWANQIDQSAFPQLTDRAG